MEDCGRIPHVPDMDLAVYYLVRKSDLHVIGSGSGCSLGFSSS